MISKYWQAKGKTEADKKAGRTYERSTLDFGCSECCNGDRCDESSHYYRPECPYCLGTGTNLNTTLQKEKQNDSRS